MSHPTNTYLLVILFHVLFAVLVVSQDLIQNYLHWEIFFVPLLHTSSWYIIVLLKLKKKNTKMVVGLLSEYTACPPDQKLPQSGGSALSAALLLSHGVVLPVRGAE